MKENLDHYQTLCVLTNADHIVIVAAYRALAGQYHPDRCKGNKEEATAKMAAINVAYGILGDPAKRKIYDDQRKATHATFNDSDDATEQAFDDEINNLKDKWVTACDVFPDLVDIRKNLEKTSHKLAFSFVVHIIEKKQFKMRKELAQSMENTFLINHFGTNPEILKYAKRLIEFGFKDAIKRLNKLVDVLGSDIDSSAIIRQIESEFKLNELRKKNKGDIQRENKGFSNKEDVDYAANLLETTRYKLLSDPYSEEALKFARLIGYEIELIKNQFGGFWTRDKYHLRKRHENKIIFTTHSRELLCVWISKNLT